MARCACGGQLCNCRIVAGPGIAISGSGTSSSPYNISGEGGVGNSLQVIDSPTIDLIANGQGTSADPLVLQGIATVAVAELTDVVDPGPAAVGEVLTWNGAGWAYQTPAAAPAGSVATACGLDGDGSAGSPLAVQARTGAQWTADGYTGTPASAGTPLYCAGPAEAAYGPPRHTTLRSSQSGPSSDRVAAAAPGFSTITAAFGLAILNNTPRQMAWAMEGDVSFIMTWAGAGNSTGDMFWSISEDGAPASQTRAWRMQAIDSEAGGIGIGDTVPCLGRDGILAPGAAKTFLIGVQFQRVAGTDAITFVNLRSRYLLQGWTI